MKKYLQEYKMSGLLEGLRFFRVLHLNNTIMKIVAGLIIKSLIVLYFRKLERGWGGKLGL